jgi:hypothetical protein
MASCAAPLPTRQTVETSGPIESTPPVQSDASVGSFSASAPQHSADELAVMALDVPGFLPAILLVPGGSEPRPLVAAAHGAGGAPEWECEYWARLTQARAFVLCLRGTAMGGGSFYYKNHYALRDELKAAERAARTAQPRIAPSGGIYAGFSQGSSMGTLMIAERGEQFPYLVLIEGFTQWSVPLARTFAGKGGKRVLFACGTASCATTAQRSVSAIERAELEARAEHAVGAGHTPGGEVMRRVEQNLPWLLAGDPLWH